MSRGSAQRRAGPPAGVAPPPPAPIGASESLAGACAALQAMGEAAWLVDAARFVVVAANARAEAMLGGPIEGLDADDVLASLEDMAWWDGARGGVEGVLESDTELACPDGTTRAVARRIAPLRLADGTALYLVQVRD
ncbi:MAG TPA: hypothetical protein VIP05_23330, partial [Burkholderiaceae bacterium]